MEIIVGGRKQIGTAILQIPESDDAWIEFDADTWHVKLNIVFVEDAGMNEGGVALSPRDDHAVLTFTNWTNTSYRTTGKPLEVGETNGRKVSLLIAGYAIEKFRSLTISFFWEN